MKGQDGTPGTGKGVAKGAALRAGVLAMRSYQREVARHLEKIDKAELLNGGGAPALDTYHAFVIMLFFQDYDAAGLSEADHAALLERHGVDTLANRKTYPMLSQSALFELFAGLGISRESIRRLLIGLSDAALLERISKGPPFPDQLGLSKQGRKLMERTAKKAAKDAGKAKAFAYL